MISIIDFEKAFDSISWKFINKVLHFFNFGENFKKWINIWNKNVNLCVIQNGIFSPFFYIGRGCRQGDPVSPYIFNLCVEIFALLIRYNTNIKGIFIKQREYCLLQYADDTVIRTGYCSPKNVLRYIAILKKVLQYIAIFIKLNLKTLLGHFWQLIPPKTPYRFL